MVKPKASQGGEQGTHSLARVRAAFYPKFDNEKPNHQIRARMVELVSEGLAAIEVSLKHNGSLFMYAGRGGAYTKNSHGNTYTAIGMFVLGRTFCEAWGFQASKKQSEFNEYLERNSLCVSMEMVTSVIGDQDHHSLKDYVVVLAVSELGGGKPKFFSTPEIIAFCGKWRLPTNNIWLFSTRTSALTFFATYDALYEEGTTTPVCKALDKVADISVPGSIDHVTFKGEMLEGLVARIVAHESLKDMENVVREYPPVILDTVSDQRLGPNLGEIMARKKTGNAQIKALLGSVCCSSFSPNHSDWLGTSNSSNASVQREFLRSHPTDLSTTKLKEMVKLIPASDFQVVKSEPSENFDFKMVFNIHEDDTFRKYQNKIKNIPGSWPLYRGFFMDLKLSNDDETNYSKDTLCEENGESSGLADEDAYLMLKLKFLPYNIRTFLITNGSQYVLKGKEPYKKFYQGQMKNWKISESKNVELTQVLDELAVFILEKYNGHKKLPSKTFLSEAEPFLEKVAKRSSENPTFTSLVKSEDVDNKASLSTEKPEGSVKISFVTVKLPPSEILRLLGNLGKKDKKVEVFMKIAKLNSKSEIHVSLDYKESYAPYLNKQLAVHINALLLSDKVAALEVNFEDGEKLSLKNLGSYVMLWKADGVSPQEANMLLDVRKKRGVKCIEVSPPVIVTGTLKFH